MQFAGDTLGLAIQQKIDLTLSIEFSNADARDLGSTAFAYSANKNEPDFLIPDPPFIEAKSYKSFSHHRVIDWKSRKNLLFWRGNSSYPYTMKDGIYDELPRIKVCKLLKDNICSDVKIYSTEGICTFFERGSDQQKNYLIGRT